MRHAFTPDLGLDDLDAAFFAHNTAMLQALVLAAKTLVILDGAKDLGAKQTVTFRLECTIVDRFGFFDFSV